MVKTIVLGSIYVLNYNNYENISNFRVDNYT